MAFVDKAVVRSAGIQAASAQIRQAEAGIQQAEAMRLPQLSADLVATRGDSPVYVFGSLLNQQKFGPSNFAIDTLNNPDVLTNLKSSLLVGLPLFTGFQITHAVHMNNLAKDVAINNQEGVLQQLRFETVSSYLRVIYDNAVLSLLDAQLSSTDKELRDASRLKDRGVVLGSDYYAAQAIGGGLKSWRIQIESDRAAALRQLQILCGISDVPESGILTEGHYPPHSLDELAQLALKNRPDIRRSQTQLKMAEVSHEQESLSLLPKVQAFAALETNTEDFKSNPSNRLYGVSAHMPFGDFTYTQRKKQTKAGLESARFSQAALEDQARIELTQTYEAYEGLLRNLPQLKETAMQAQKSLEMFRPLYHSGRQSILDVLRAEEAAARTNATYQEALFNFNLSYLRLMASVGLLDEKSLQCVAEAIEVNP